MKMKVFIICGESIIFDGKLSLLKFLDNSVKNKDKFLKYLRLLDKKQISLKENLKARMVDTLLVHIVK